MNGRASWRFRDASGPDAVALSAFARDVFERTFAPDNDPADVTAYVDTAFTPAVQADEIAERSGFTFLAETDAAAMAAFAQVSVDGRELEVKRFYVAHEHHGTGLAQALMQHVFERARSLGVTSVRLGVWEKNQRAIAFYRKLGFVQIGTQPFLLGSDLQTDWVMQNTTLT